VLFNDLRKIGMMAGCGEFFTVDRRVGHIGQSVGRHDIRY